MDRRRRHLFDSDRTSTSARNDLRSDPGSGRASAPEGEIQDRSLRSYQPPPESRRKSTSTPSENQTTNSSDSNQILESADSEDTAVTHDEDLLSTTFSPGRTRSGKRFRALHVSTDTSYVSFDLDLADRMDTNDAFLIESDLNKSSNSMNGCFEAYHIYQQLDEDLVLSTGIHPLAFSARVYAEDTPCFHAAIKGPDRKGFIEEMKAELEQLSLMDAFVTVPRQKAIDEGKPIIDSIWAFKRKRFPYVAVKKLKVRFCVRGDIQKESVYYFDTYWATARLLLLFIASIVLNLKTKQVDFTLAFVQAKAEPSTYIEMPHMFRVEGYIQQRGFKASNFDPCFFKSKHVIIPTFSSSVTVMLLYLACNSRPDIACSVNQYASFLQIVQN